MLVLEGLWGTTHPHVVLGRVTPLPWDPDDCPAGGHPSTSTHRGGLALSLGTQVAHGISDIV